MMKKSEEKKGKKERKKRNRQKSNVGQGKAADDIDSLYSTCDDTADPGVLYAGSKTDETYFRRYA